MMMMMMLSYLNATDHAILCLLVHNNNRIENFIYSMVKFGLISCTLMVCVSDHKCIELCDAAHFPCYDFQYHYQQREVMHCYCNTE